MATPPFTYLMRVKWSDNTCSVGWSCIWAEGWDMYSMEGALRMCPEGYFTPTTFISLDERRSWGDNQKEQFKNYGAPVYVMWRGAYFTFPLDRGALQLMVAIGLESEALVMAASGGRSEFPERGFKTGGVPWPSQ